LLYIKAPSQVAQQVRKKVSRTACQLLTSGNSPTSPIVGLSCK
jgi:hypothetical protein